jgi:hypothetical protein
MAAHQTSLPATNPSNLQATMCTHHPPAHPPTCGGPCLCPSPAPHSCQAPGQRRRQPPCRGPVPCRLSSGWLPPHPHWCWSPCTGTQPHAPDCLISECRSSFSGLPNCKAGRHSSYQLRRNMQLVADKSCPRGRSGSSGSGSTSICCRRLFEASGRQHGGRYLCRFGFGGEASSLPGVGRSGADATVSLMKSRRGSEFTCALLR